MDKYSLLQSEDSISMKEDDEDTPEDHSDRSFPNHVPRSSQYRQYGGLSSTNDSADCDDTVEADDQPSKELKIYKRRWYIMTMFGMFAFCQGFVWNTWGPISGSAEDAFGWHDSTIAWLNNWGPVAYILCGLLYPWLLQVKGLRWAVLSSSLLVSSGATMRVFTSEPETATILIHIGQFLNGLGGPIAMCALSMVSATWFPPNERVTATGLGICIALMGVGFPFLVDSFIQKERDEIMRYMYYSCGFCWLVTLVILIYYPAKPPSPPALSAIVERDKYWAGMWSLRRKGAFWVVALTYGISTGVLNCWTSVLDVNLKPFGIKEMEAGWIGFYSILGGAVMSLLVGRFAACFTRFMKFVIVFLFVSAVGTFVAFALMLIKTIPFSNVLLYTTVVVGTSVVNGGVPLLFELACEMAYPTSEGAANGVMTYLNNVFGLIFLAIFSFPNIGTMWMNWTVIGSTAACIPLILSLRGRFKRLEIDEQLNPESFAEQEIIVNYEDDDAMIK